jgi:hypothetical protein
LKQWRVRPGVHLVRTQSSLAALSQLILGRPQSIPLGGLDGEVRRNERQHLRFINISTTQVESELTIIRRIVGVARQDQAPPCSALPSLQPRRVAPAGSFLMASIRRAGGVKIVAGLIWKKIAVTYEGRVISAQYARDGAYVRVSLPGRAERRMPHRKQRAEALARQLLLEIVVGGSVTNHFEAGRQVTDRLQSALRNRPSLG